MWQPNELPQEAYKRGVNYFFAYSMDDDQIGDYLDGLAELCSDPTTRGKIFVAVGMEDFSNREAVTTHVEKCLSRLRTDYVDAFFLEYVCRGDEDAANETMGWMRGAGGLVVAEGGKRGIDGAVRFLGCSTHDRCVGVNLLRRERGSAVVDVGDRVEVDLVGVAGETTGVGVGSGDGDKTESGNVRTAPLTSFETSSQKYDLRLEFKDSTPCQMDFLMVRYNMAHTKSEWRLFPVARARDVPVIAFTSTRWNTLTQTHPAWQDLPPTVAQCMDFCASHPAVHVVVNSPTTVAQLTTWVDALSVTQKKGMPLTEIEKWNKYGDLVYEEDATFETLF